MDAPPHAPSLRVAHVYTVHVHRKLSSETVPPSPTPFYQITSLAVGKRSNQKGENVLKRKLKRKSKRDEKKINKERGTREDGQFSGTARSSV